MTVSPTSSATSSGFIPFNAVSFQSTEQFHGALRAQLAQDIEVLFAYAKLPSPLVDACRYVMTGQGKLVRPLMVASAFASINNSNSERTEANSDDIRYSQC